MDRSLGLSIATPLCFKLRPCDQLIRSEVVARFCSVFDLLMGENPLNFIMLVDLPKKVLTLFLRMDPLDLCKGFLVGVSCSCRSFRAASCASRAVGDGVLEYTLRSPVEGE